MSLWPLVGDLHNTSQVSSQNQCMHVMVESVHMFELNFSSNPTT